MGDQSKVVSVRFKPEELRQIAAAASAQRLSIGRFVKWATERQALLSRPGARLIRSASGAEIAFWSNRPDVITTS